MEVGITYNRMLCNDFTGPVRFRLNMPEVALELKRVWHAWVRHWTATTVFQLNTKMVIKRGLSAFWWWTGYAARFTVPWETETVLQHTLTTLVQVLGNTSIWTSLQTVNEKMWSTEWILFASECALAFRAKFAAFEAGLRSSCKNNEMAPAPELSVFVSMAPAPAPELCFFITWLWLRLCFVNTF